MMTNNKRRLLTIIICLLSYTPLLAQNFLASDITIAPQKQQSIAHLLELLTDKQHFSFAYNNKIVPADSLVSLSAYSGTLLGALDKILGEQYEFKEVPGYIVLRYAPHKLFITAEAHKDQGTKTIIKGYVFDATDQKPVIQASVYEKNQLSSTFTDAHGYFQLELKNNTGSSVMLTVSKVDYRDASTYILPDVIVHEKRPAKNYTYYPDNAMGNDVEHNSFARFFISSRQLLQGLNLGNFFASSPYQISLTPGLSTHGLYNSQVIDHLSLNLLGGYTAGIDGLELAGVFNINRKDMRSTQLAGVFNFVGGNARGVQFAGIYNRVLNHISGLQLAGLVNKTGYFNSGLQMTSLTNINQHANGVHIAGLANTAGCSKGITIAGLTNIARDSSNIQIAGLINKSGHVASLQASGIINIAKKVSGIQVGFINFADSSDYPIGIINFIKNGEKGISLSTDESLFAHADFRSGGRVLYGLMGVGYQSVANKTQFLFNIGLGAHIIRHQQLFLNTEYVATFNRHYQTNAIRVLPGYHLYKHWDLFAGPSFNIASAEKNDALKINGWILNRSISKAHTNTTYLGLTIGIQYHFKI